MNMRQKYLLLALGFLSMWIGLDGAVMASMPQKEDAFSRRFRWEYGAKRYDMSLAIPWQVYHYYQEKQRTFHNYAVYAYEHPEYSILPDLANMLNCAAESEGFNRDQTLAFVISFVQQLDYQPEQGEYPKFPVETLAEHGGDCEDTSILLSALLRLLGYRTLLINPPRHMAIAVACEDCRGTWYEKGGVRYFYVETTASGYAVGDAPEDYKDSKDKVYTMQVRPRDLWFLRSFVPQRGRSGNRLFFVSEDSGPALATSQRGDPVWIKAIMRTVQVDGTVTTRRSLK